MMSGPHFRWRRWSLGIAGVAWLVLQAAPAGAEPPERLAGQVTDRVAALDPGGQARVRDALDSLYDEHRMRLWVVYVAGFDGRDADSWVERTAALSGLGDQDVLLAVATEDREYRLYSPGLPAQVSDAEFTEVRVERIEPALREGDWALASVEAADGLAGAAAPQGMGALLAVGAAVAVGGAGVWLYSRRKRGRRLTTGLAKARGIDPEDTAALAALPVEVLDERSRELLVEMDNALRASAEELELARGEFGETRTQPFTSAFTGAKDAMAAAFALRQRLDDDVPETRAQRGDLLVELISRLGRADRELDARVAEFDELRDLLLDAPGRLDALTQKVVGISVRLPESTATWTRLTGEFPAPALAPVRDNLAMAQERLTFAERAIADGRAAVARPVGEQGAAVAAIRGAEGAVGQASTLLDAVDNAETNIRGAVAGLPAALDGLRADLAAAERLTGAGGPDLTSAVAAARSALEKAPGSDNPLGAYAEVTAADTDLDNAVAAATERRQRAALLEQALGAASAQISAAEDFVGTRRGAVGAQARTRLAEARRHLDAAGALSTTDPAAALEHAQHAVTLGQQAAAAAESDVRRWESARAPRAGGDTGAVLGGILIGSILGGGGPGRGGYRPSSFGGSRGTRRHGGGRF
ncbi:TPM domain-containing protein [Actinokineospora sp. 24-640]